MPYFKVNATWPEGYSEQPYVWVEDHQSTMFMENQAVDKVMGIYGLGRGSVQVTSGAMPPDFNPQAIGGTVVGDVGNTGYVPDLYETLGGWGQDEAPARYEKDAPYVPVANKNIPSGAGTGGAASSLSTDIMGDIGGGYSSYSSYNPISGASSVYDSDEFAGDILKGYPYNPTTDIMSDIAGGKVSIQYPEKYPKGGLSPAEGRPEQQREWLLKNLHELTNQINAIRSDIQNFGPSYQSNRLSKELEGVIRRRDLLLKNKGMELVTTGWTALGQPMQEWRFTGIYGPDVEGGEPYIDPEGRTGIGSGEEQLYTPPYGIKDSKAYQGLRTAKEAAKQSGTGTGAFGGPPDTNVFGGPPTGGGDVAVEADNQIMQGDTASIIQAASQVASELNIEGLQGFLDALAQPMIDPSTGLAIIPKVPAGLIESATREIVENIPVLDAAGERTGESRPQVIGYELDPAIQAVLDMHQQRANFQELALNRISDRQIQDSQNRTNLELADKTGRSQEEIAEINRNAMREVAEANGITEREITEIMAGVQRENVISQTGAEIDVADIESQMHRAIAERSGAAQESVADTYASAQKFTATQQLRGIETQTEVDKYVADRSLEATRAGLTPRQYMGLEGTIARGGLPIPERMQLGRIQYTGGLEAPAFREMQETISRGGLSPEQVLEQEYIRKTGGLSPTDFGDLQMGIQRGGISPEQLLRQKELEYIGGLSPTGYAEHQMGMQRGGLTPDQRLAELRMAQQPQMFSDFANLLGNPVAVGTLQGLGANLGGMFGGGGGGMFGGGGGSGMLSGAAPISGRTLTADPNPTMPWHSWGQNRTPTLAQLNAPGPFAAMHTGRGAAKGLTPDQVYDEAANVSPWSSQGEQSRYAIGGPLS